MTKYVIKTMVFGTPIYLVGAIHDSGVFTVELKDAMRFDYMSEANLYAISHMIFDYTVEPVSAPVASEETQ